MGGRSVRSLAEHDATPLTIRPMQTRRPPPFPRLCSDGRALATHAQVRHSLLQPSDRPCFLELSPDGGRVFTVGDHAAWAWDANSGVVEQELVGHGALLTGVAVAGSKLMMVSGHDGRVTVWDVGGRWQQTVETSSAVPMRELGGLAPLRGPSQTQGLAIYVLGGLRGWVSLHGIVRNEGNDASGRLGLATGRQEVSRMGFRADGTLGLS